MSLEGGREKGEREDGIGGSGGGGGMAKHGKAWRHREIRGGQPQME